MNGSSNGNGIKREIESDDDGPKMGMADSDSEADVLPKANQPRRSVNKSYKEDSDSDDDMPLAQKAKKRSRGPSEDSPARKKIKQEPGTKSKKKRDKKKEKSKTEVKSEKNNSSSTKIKKEVASPMTSPNKSKAQLKREEEEKNVWRWWEEKKPEDGSKWKTLSHNGPMLAPDYEKLPKDVHFAYNGKVMRLSESAEEVAGFYAKMLDHDYTSKDVFNTNFMKDWRKEMSDEEKKIITDLKKCDFKEMFQHFKAESEAKKNRTKEEKQALKAENEELVKQYGWCNMDGHKQRIANFRIEPPGLFRGRGNHPKMGMLKKRTMPEHVIINCGSESAPPKPPAGHKWKEVRHDNKVTWLACWVENVQGNFKYVMLNASSRLKGEKDWTKYETARKLHTLVDKIRENYIADFRSKEMKIRQRAVALYFIDKLALRAGNEKDEDEADTVGCCSLRVEHIKLHEKYQDGKENVVEFDFLGKDSIRYQNAVPVEKRVFKNLALFMDNKKPDDDLFDRINTTILNQHLKDLMPGLTAKVFRTYNASITLEKQLELLTDSSDPMPAKVLAYNRANRAVAILCNHQRAVPKSFDKSMENLQTKIDEKRKAVSSAKKEAKKAKSYFKSHKSNDKAKKDYEQKKKAYNRMEEQLMKLEMQRTDKDENKDIALGTSKLNYLDPRITVAWSKKWDVPLEKLYSKTQREKFQWAIDMADKDFVFQDIQSDKKGKDDDEDEDSD